MNNIKTGLGRGLEALINPKVKDKIESPVALSSNDIKFDDGESFDVLVKIPVDKITPNPYQPRTEFNSQALEELKKSILENGLIQPITVRRITNNKYELISGERRLRSCKEIGLKEIPAFIIKVESKEAMIELSLIENIQREELNPIEIALAYKKLIDECNLSQEEIGIKVGKDRSTITNTLRLLKLPEKIQEGVAKNIITTGHARALINLPNELSQLEIYDKIVKQNLSVRKVEELVRIFFKTPTKKKLKKILETGTFSSTMKKEIEERLQRILGTKVSMNQNKDGKGEIVIEFYSSIEFERLYELLESIGK
ncbi:ParB/RepB/Spo0J family partition protein [Stygiobacter electus]|uniref:ParB/RepB/Spo0J family partition protein n=1 Tax=Stygiobacter electus TaxID=3032292 RepID=A0AAE3TC11_9BACT|nr:ParB/RepB/Spo0J family partition protein [Stygiobacter electus]MDF1611415.1 ParB/RepB/Spo0J family partition protein [Stygiobacter electus]